MITKVNLKNWRSHLDTELNFSEGTNCFIGNVGTGKTTIMDAICFGLFGTFLQLQQKKLKLEDIIMKKPVQKEQAEVTVYFDIDNIEWSIKRTVTKGKSTAELRKSGELIEGPQPSKVTEEVEKLLKMNYELFSRAVYSEQNQLDMFLTIPKGQRMKKIDELLAIDRFEKARANTKVLKNKCLSFVDDKEEMLRSLEADESLRKIEIIKREMVEMKEKEALLSRQLEDTVRRKVTVAKDVMILKEQQKKMQNIEQETKKYTALIELTESDIERIKTSLVDFAEKTSEELNAEILRINEETNRLGLCLSEEKANLDRLKEEYAEENAKIRLIEGERIPKLKQESEEFAAISEKLRKISSKKVGSDIEEKKKELEKSQMNMQKSIAKISELEDGIHDLGLAGSVCPVCNSSITESKKTSLLSKKKKQLEELNESVVDSRKLSEKLKEEIAKLDIKFRETEKMEDRFYQIKDSAKQLKSFSSELDDLNEKVKVFLNQKKMFEKNIDMLDGNLKGLVKRQDDIKQVLSKKEEANIKIERLKEYAHMLAKLSVERDMLSSFSISVLDKVEQDYQNIIGMEKELQTRLLGQADIFGEKQKLLIEIEGKKKVLESYMAEIKKFEAISEQLQLLENSLEATQEQLRKDFVTAVNEAMQTIWPELYPYRDFSSIRLGIEDGDYVLQLQDSTGWITADGVVSGGERSIACLGLRIALSLVLAPSIDMLVLDEPTANLDARTVEVLANVLRERITNFVEQVFLITHSTEMENAVSGYLYRLERDKSKDGTTIVTLVNSPE
ncbi:MAG: SMC family ATPase [Candidatus Aenigmatarchaeota archaeon]